MHLKSFLTHKKSIFFFLIFLVFINGLIPFCFIGSPLGLGIEADALDYRIPLVQLMLRSNQFPHLMWTYVDDFPSLAEILIGLFTWGGSYFTPNVDALYRLLPILSYIGFSGICYGIGRIFLSPIWALFGVLQIMTASAVVVQDNAVMIDLFNGMLFAAAVYFLLKRVLEKGELKYTFFSGLFLGFSFATRYTLLPAIFFLSLLFFWCIYRKKEKKFIQEVFTFSVALLIPVLFFLIRNFLVNGNPVYPLFNSFLKGAYFSPTRYSEIFGMVERYGHERTFKDFLLLPFRFAFEKRAFDYSVGPLLLMYLPSFFFLFMGEKTKQKKQGRFLLLVLFLLLVSWFISSRHARFMYHCYPLFVFPGLIAIKSLLKEIPQKSKIPYFFSAFFILIALAGTYKHLKKHDEEKNGQAFVTRAKDKIIPQWANAHLKPVDKVLFLQRTGNVYLFKNDFVFAYPHIYANSLLDYREYSHFKDYVAQLKASGASYIYSSGEKEWIQELMKKFDSQEISRYLELKRVMSNGVSGNLLEILYK